VDSPPSKSQHISDHLANERTALAWIRTAIAVMTLGVAINRFSLFLMEFHQVAPQARALNRHAETVGVGLVILGIVLMCSGVWHYLHIADAIEREDFRNRRLAIVLTSLAVLAVGGSALVWLFLT
jgi:putative membrane protein